MNKKKYMDAIDDYLTLNLGGTFWISEMPVIADFYPLSLKDRILIFLGLKPEYFPVRIDWEYKGDRLNTIYSGPAEDWSLEQLAAKLYTAWLKKNEQRRKCLWESIKERKHEN